MYARCGPTRSWRSWRAAVVVGILFCTAVGTFLRRRGNGWILAEANGRFITLWLADQIFEQARRTASADEQQAGGQGHGLAGGDPLQHLLLVDLDPLGGGTPHQLAGCQRAVGRSGMAM